ncbi:hypothetical protein ABFB10_22760 [Ponticoccus litoralis]|uniref:Uncharacterized protein n=1 Tax=Ponticoccus litoralis TaxID=422297 RepID=A0AAW9SEW8_9RHOB
MVIKSGWTGTQQPNGDMGFAAEQVDHRVVDDQFNANIRIGFVEFTHQRGQPLDTQCFGHRDPHRPFQRHVAVVQLPLHLFEMFPNLLQRLQHLLACGRGRKPGGRPGHELHAQLRLQLA